MKIGLTITVLLFLSRSALAEPPYSGTVWVDADILTVEDPSAFVQVVAAGSGSRQMYDRRLNNGAGGWTVLNALLFNAYYTDSDVVEIQVNPEFDSGEAAGRAAFYGHAIGRLPSALRMDVQTVWIHKGDQPFGGGNSNILIHTGASSYHGEWLEETLFHEACHTSLDWRVANTAAWVNAQSADPDFISTYARDNPNREDVAESCLMHFAMRHREDRISAATLAIITETIPNRSLVLDSHNINPVLSSDRSSFFDDSSSQLTLTGVRVADTYYAVVLDLADSENYVFTLNKVDTTDVPNTITENAYEDGTLTVSLLLAAGQRYSAVFELVSENPIQFRLLSAELLP